MHAISTHHMSPEARATQRRHQPRSSPPSTSRWRTRVSVNRSGQPASERQDLAGAGEAVRFDHAIDVGRSAWSARRAVVAIGTLRRDRTNISVVLIPRALSDRDVWTRKARLAEVACRDRLALGGRGAAPGVPRSVERRGLPKLAAVARGVADGAVADDEGARRGVRFVTRHFEGVGTRSERRQSTLRRRLTAHGRTRDIPRRRARRRLHLHSDRRAALAHVASIDFREATQAAVGRVDLDVDRLSRLRDPRNTGPIAVDDVRNAIRSA